MWHTQQGKDNAGSNSSRDAEPPERVYGNCRRKDHKHTFCGFPQNPKAAKLVEAANSSDYNKNRSRSSASGSRRPTPLDALDQGSLPTPAKKPRQGAATAQKGVKDVKAGLAFTEEDEDNDTQTVYLPANMACVYMDEAPKLMRIAIQIFPNCLKPIVADTLSMVFMPKTLKLLVLTSIFATLFILMQQTTREQEPTEKTNDALPTGFLLGFLSLCVGAIMLIASELQDVERHQDLPGSTARAR